MADINASDLDKCIEEFYTRNPFVKLMEMKIKSLSKGEVQLELTIRKDLTNVYEIAHGGAMMSLGDMAMGAACLTCGKKVVTLEFSMNFIRATVMGTKVLAIGRIIHNGSKTMVAECVMEDENGKLLGKAHGTFFVTGSM